MEWEFRVRECPLTSRSWICCTVKSNEVRVVVHVADVVTGRDKVQTVHPPLRAGPFKAKKGLIEGYPTRRKRLGCLEVAEEVNIIKPAKRLRFPGNEMVPTAGEGECAPVLR